MSMRRYLVSAAFLAILGVAPVVAQQPAPEGQRQDDDVPTLTTDDVAPPAAAEDEDTGEDAQEDPNLTPEERADAGQGKKGGSEAKAGPRGKKENPEEVAWRRRYEAAKKQADETKRTAENAELRVTEIRNQIADPTDTSSKDGLRAELESQGAVVRQAKEAASAAAAELTRIKAEGDAEGFRPVAGPTATKKTGEPNEAFYLKEYQKAKQQLADANREVTLYQNQVNDLRVRQLNESGSGDNFVQLKLQAQLNEALEKLEKAQQKQATASSRLDDVRSQARRSGITIREQ